LLLNLTVIYTQDYSLAEKGPDGNSESSISMCENCYCGTNHCS